MPDLPIKDAKPFQPILKKSSSLPKIGRKKGKRVKKKSIKIVDSKPKIEEPKRKEESSKKGEDFPKIDKEELKKI